VELTSGACPAGRTAQDDPMTEVFVVGLILWIITVVALLVSLL
jgi:hypothetical protein